MKTMKRLLAVLLAAVLLMCAPFTVVAEGEAEPMEWIEIYTIEDLYCVRNDLTANYKLMNDLDLTEATAPDGDWSYGGRGWNPIGSENIYGNSSFSGRFDGNAHCISGLSFSLNSVPSGAGSIIYVGLFSNVSGEVKNLSIEGSINISSISNKVLLGAIAGSSSGIISNCISEVNIVVSNSCADYVGGIVGKVEGNVANCINRGSISVRGSQTVGGIAGRLESGTVESCSNIGEIRTAVGATFESGNTASNCYTAGIVGYAAKGAICNSYNGGQIYTEALGGYQRQESGGYYLNPHVYTYTYYCHAYASGIAYKATSINQCYNRSDITATQASGASYCTLRAAGIAYEGTISTCYNVGTVGTSQYAISPSKNVSRCFFLNGTGKDTTGAVSLTNAQMKIESMYTEWDFVSTWTIDNTSDYPYPVLKQSLQCRHQNTAIMGFQEATCTNDGYTGDIVCEDCNITIEQGTVLPASGHKGKEPVAENEVPATCTETGRFERVIYCAVCGEELSRETVYEGDPLGHTSQTYTTASTCAENGFTITICTRCGETLSSEILPRLDHTWNDGEVTQQPTCTEKGVKTYTCQNCDASYTEPVDVLDHDWDDGEVTKAPSCTEAGEMTYTCSTGGETRTEPIEKLDHEIVLVPGKDASCTEPGLTDGWQCKTCQKWFAEQQTIEPLDHDPQIGAVVEPTCTEPGYTPFICSRCGETISKTDPTDALGHDYQPTYEWSADNSTVTASLICTRCDDVQAKETVNTACKTVEATCMNPGQVTYTSEGFANKAFYVQTKTIEIAQKPHMTTQIREVSPTCDREGVGSYWTCGTCDGIFEDEAATRPLEEPPVLPKLPHTPGEPVTENETAATCTAEGSYDTVVYCFACGQELSRETTETPVLDHADADNDGKCDFCGNQMQGGDHCKFCGKVHDGGFFDKLTGFFHQIFAVFKR